jgi:hypothetical protein
LRFRGELPDPSQERFRVTKKAPQSDKSSMENPGRDGNAKKKEEGSLIWVIDDRLPVVE